MADMTQHRGALSAPASLAFAITGRISRTAAAMIRAASRQDHIQALQALSDAQLAARGLTREDIPRHVFGDRYYL